MGKAKSKFNIQNALGEKKKDKKGAWDKLKMAFSDKQKERIGLHCVKKYGTYEERMEQSQCRSSGFES